MVIELSYVYLCLFNTHACSFKCAVFLVDCFVKFFFNNGSILDSFDWYLRVVPPPKFYNLSVDSFPLIDLCTF